ncbi:MAG TPA: hypothetical protein PK529_03085 [Verrucomicrobiales bacterium]|nr:hypothetical protein [Verrucomicrobiales bacterium]
MKRPCSFLFSQIRRTLSLFDRTCTDKILFPVEVSKDEVIH